MKKFFFVIVLLMALFILSLFFFRDKFNFELSTNKFEDSHTYKDYVSKDNLVFINNWASWCEPCIEEIPFLNHLSSTYGSEVQFLSFSHDKDTSVTKAAMKKHRFNWKEITLYDYDYKMVVKSEYQENSTVNINELPYTYLLKNGEVVYRKYGKLDSLETVNAILKYK